MHAEGLFTAFPARTDQQTYVPHVDVLAIAKTYSGVGSTLTLNPIASLWQNGQLRRQPCGSTIETWQDCVSGLYQMFVRKQRQALTGGSTAVMQRWQKSPGERYPSLTHQVICSCERCFNMYYSI